MGSRVKGVAETARAGLVAQETGGVRLGKIARVELLGEQSWSGLPLCHAEWRPAERDPRMEKRPVLVDLTHLVAQRAASILHRFQTV